MPRRELLTSLERLELLAFPTDQGELIRLYVLTKADIAFIRQHRGDHNRLGIAMLMSYLRHPGRVLAGNESPYAPVLDIVADQLGIPIDMWQVYAERDATRRSHLLELLPRLGMEQFGTRHYRSISAWLDPTALQTTRGVTLAQAVVEELRKRLIVLPPVAVIERLCAETMTRAQRKVFALLTEGMNDEQFAKLDRLLEQREGSSYSTLAWLRMPPGAPTPRAVLGHIERLNTILDLALPPDASRKLHQNRLLQLAREAGQTAVYQFKEYEQARRYGTLVALMMETAATLTDEIVDLNDRLIGSFFTKSKNKYERAFAEQGKAINDKVRLYAKVGAALVDAREQGRNPFAAIEAVVPWESFSASVKEAAELARGEDFDALSLIGEHYPQLRRYAPTLIETLQFRPAPVARELIEAVEVLREMNRDGLRKVPQNAPLGFIRRRWDSYVVGPEGIDRRFYELCVMAELKNSLRSGDVSVVGSRQFRDFEDYLMQRTEFDRRLAQGELRVAVPTTGATYIEERMSPMHVASYVEQLGRTHSKPTVKQHLAAIRMLFDWLVTGHVMQSNPAHAVRGPKHSVRKGKTSVLSADEMRELLAAIDTTSLLGLRDRALVALMGYTFARVGAATGMQVQDFYVQKRRGWVRLHEKGGKVTELPCHHNLDQYLEQWIAASGLGTEPEAPLFPTLRYGRLTDRTPLPQANVHMMIQRRARAAGLRTKISAHSFRATGITTYLQNGGKLEIAQQMAGHESARTTGLYDRRSDEVALDEVERIAY